MEAIYHSSLQSNGVRSRIREATRVAHARLELHVGLSNDRFERKRYVRFLERMWGFQYPLEERLAAFPRLRTVLPDVPLRARAKLAREDLRVLAPDTQLSICSDLPQTDTLPRALGVLYVLEGATLGGRSLLKALEVFPEETEGVGRYLRGYGPQTSYRWKRFLNALETSVISDPDQLEATQGAVDAFSRLEAWFEQGAGARDGH
ncbi:MAG: biliverdin-producing heme oxygenase [Polyangiaceae bacterium]|nr:biliverdin-producing heme oxygenase [Myxococcales bacterium]MCB9585808.1 biliverdin-producing heme oxygenase [Polyangiaceae bacterium]MCB9607263.1 biliverdin-producing heme oxygenase [Polyangiaceae bacterium]